MDYISIYYNVTSQDKANYLPSTTREIYSAILIILHCGEKKRLSCFILIPQGSAGGDNLTLYLEVLTHSLDGFYQLSQLSCTSRHLR